MHNHLDIQWSTDLKNIPACVDVNLFDTILQSMEGLVSYENECGKFLKKLAS